jgi:hypothetical protein
MVSAGRRWLHSGVKASARDLGRACECPARLARLVERLDSTRNDHSRNPPSGLALKILGTRMRCAPWTLAVPPLDIRRAGRVDVVRRADSRVRMAVMCQSRER